MQDCRGGGRQAGQQHEAAGHADLEFSPSPGRTIVHPGVDEQCKSAQQASTPVLCCVTLPVQPGLQAVQCCMDPLTARPPQPTPGSRGACGQLLLKAICLALPLSKCAPMSP